MRSIFALFILALVCTGCKKEDSIQTYFVEHQERPDYSVVDISSSLLDLDKMDLNTEEKEALDSFDKLHVLIYKSSDSTQAEYEKELKAIKILPGLGHLFSGGQRSFFLGLNTRP